LSTEVLDSLRAPISALLSRARNETVSRPPSAAELVEDGKAVRAARGYLEALSRAVRRDLDALGGYDTTHTGEFVEAR
jgi:hypothetical protein